jgi:hypothetical protein
MTNFLLRDNLHRNTAPVLFFNIIYQDNYSVVYKTCTATAPAHNKNCTMPTFAKASVGEDGKKHTIRRLAEHNLPILPGR